jgi:hypothetical protein
MLSVVFSLRYGLNTYCCLDDVQLQRVKRMFKQNEYYLTYKHTFFQKFLYSSNNFTYNLFTLHTVLCIRVIYNFIANYFYTLF